MLRDNGARSAASTLDTAARRLPGPAIELEDLRRTFSIRTGWRRGTAKEIEAVRGVTFTVDRGELFGLLGPNGAGKTTIIKMLNTLLLPSGGVGRVLGQDVARNPVAVRRRIGYVFGGDRGLYDRLSALDNLRYFAELYGVDPRSQRRRIAALLDQVGLTGRERERVEGYSRGMRQRLHIARGLLNEPEVLFLDEPSIGVDPVAARELRAIIRQLADGGTTIFLTTHYMAEADELCDRVAVIDAGLVRVIGPPADIKSAVVDDVILEISAYGVADGHLEVLRRLPAVRSVSLEHGDNSELTVSLRADAGSNIHAVAIDALRDLVITRVNTRQASLEDAYISLLGSADAPAMSRG
jgi:ABC-2 type transport system ATP-binding protein